MKSVAPTPITLANHHYWPVIVLYQASAALPSAEWAGIERECLKTLKAKNCNKYMMFIKENGMKREFRGHPRRLAPHGLIPKYTLRWWGHGALWWVLLRPMVGFCCQARVVAANTPTYIQRSSNAE